MENAAIKRFYEFMLSTPAGMTGKNARYYIFHRLGPWVACFSHGSWIIVFALNDLMFMAYYNVVVTALFVLYGILWTRMMGPMWFIHLLYFIEIPLHALLGTLYTGPVTMFWMFALVPAIIGLITPQFSWALKATICFVLLAFACALGAWAITNPAWAQVSNGWTIFLFVTNTISVSMAFVFYLGVNQFLVESAEENLKREFDRAEGLLRNILPNPIALRLKDGERVIANEHRDVSVIFADIADFTAVSSELSPTELVEMLNLVFSEFDNLADKHGAEKIKTIGDAYMAVVGVPEDNGRHAEIAVALASDMINAADTLSEKSHFDIKLRVGINSGPVVAGVIGKRKFAYDLWGDAVNMASRMESQSKPGEIIISESTANLLSDRFVVTPQGSRDIKGKGATAIFGVSVGD